MFVDYFMFVRSCVGMFVMDMLLSLRSRVINCCSLVSRKYLFLIRTKLVSKWKVQGWLPLVSVTKKTRYHTSLSFVLLLSFLSLK